MALGLWALGWAMILLSALVRLPAAVATSIGLVVIAGHNLFDRVRSAHPIWSLLHSPNFLLNTPEHVVSVCRWFARLEQRRTEAWLSYYLSAPR